MVEKKQGKFDKVLGILGKHSAILEKHSAILEKHSLKFLENEDQHARMDNKIDQKFDEVLSGQDKIMRELEKAREDRELAKLKDDQQDQRLDKIEAIIHA